MAIANEFSAYIQLAMEDIASFEKTGRPTVRYVSTTGTRTCMKFCCIPLMCFPCVINSCLWRILLLPCGGLGGSACTENTDKSLYTACKTTDATKPALKTMFGPGYFKNSDPVIVQHMLTRFIEVFANANLLTQYEMIDWFGGQLVILGFNIDKRTLVPATVRQTVDQLLSVIVGNVGNVGNVAPALSQ